jgi:hypothetical protein
MHRSFLAIIVSALLLLVTAAGLLVVHSETRPHAAASLLLNRDAGS